MKEMSNVISGGSRGKMRGMHPPPAPTVHRNWPLWGPKLKKKFLGRGHSPLPDPSPVGGGTPPPPSRGLWPPGFDHIPLHQRFLDPPLNVMLTFWTNQKESHQAHWICYSLAFTKPWARSRGWRLHYQTQPLQVCAYQNGDVTLITAPCTTNRSAAGFQNGNVT